MDVLNALLMSYLIGATVGSTEAGQLLKEEPKDTNHQKDSTDQKTFNCWKLFAVQTIKQHLWKALLFKQSTDLLLL